MNFAQLFLCWGLVLYKDCMIVMTVQILYDCYDCCGHFYSALSPTTLGAPGCTRSKKACKCPFNVVVAAAASLAVEEQSTVAITLVHEALFLKREKEPKRKQRDVGMA